MPVDPILIAAIINGVGSALEAAGSGGEQQRRQEFTGAASPQALQVTGVQGMQQLLNQLQMRPPLDFSGVQAQNPMP